MEYGDWCVPEPAPLQVIRAHASDVSAADMTRAGGGAPALATGGADGGVRLWRWGAALGFVPAAGARRAHRYGVTALAFSDAGMLLATCGADGAARVWAARDLRPLRDLSAAGGASPRALCWAGVALLATAQDDGALVLWDARRGAEVAQVAGEDGAPALAALAALGGGGVLAAADAEGALRLYSLPELRPLGRRGDAHDLGALCAAAAGARLATGGQDALVRLWAVRGGRAEELARLAGHASAVTCVRWASLHTDTLGSASMDRTARLWSCSRAECLRVLDAHVRFVTSLAFSPDDSLLVTGSNDRTARVWSLRALPLDAGVAECSARAHFGVGDLQGIAEVPDDLGDGAHAAGVGAGGGAARGARGARALWAGRGGHAGAVNGIAARGALLATACSDRVVRVFERAAADVGLELRHALAGHRYPVMAVDFCPAGDALVSAGLDGLVIVWDVQSGARLRTLSAQSMAGGSAGGGGVRAARAGGRAGWVLAGSDDGVLALWDLEDDGPVPLHVYAEHADAVTCCAWGVVGGARVLLAGGAGGELLVYRASPPTVLWRQDNAHDLGVQSCDAAEADADGELLLATSGCDSAARLWTLRCDGDDAALREVRVLRGHGGTVTCVRLGAGALLATTATDMFARVWEVQSGKCMLCVRLAGAGAAVALSRGALVAGALTGDLALWELPDARSRSPGPEDKAAEGEADAEEKAEGADWAARWSPARVVAWLREHLPPAEDIEEDIAGAEERLIRRIEEVPIDGGRLLEAPLRELMADFGVEFENDIEQGEVETDAGGEGEGEGTWLVREVRWLRAMPRLRRLAERRRERLPHGLLCPVSHRVLLEPVSCADGYTYDRTALAESLLAGDPGVSPVSGRPLAHARTAPNGRARRDARRALSAVRAARPPPPAPDGMPGADEAAATS